MWRSRIGAVVLAAALGTWSWSGAAAQQPAGTWGGALLRPGDVLQLTVHRRPDFTGEFTIDGEGRIGHPLLSEVTAAGVPLSELRERIRRFLLEFDEEPRFALRPLVRVSVGGEVRQPNLIALSPDVTLAEAVAAAGGATQHGRLDKVVLLRDGKRAVVDLTKAEPGPAQTPVRSGDQLFVPRQRSIFREYIAPAGSIAGALVGLANLLF